MAQGLNKFKTKKSKHRDSLNDAQYTQAIVIIIGVLCLRFYE